MSRRVVIIGGGHNGLTAALRLAKAGLEVTVCERRELLGGLAAREEFHPGYWSPGVLHDTTLWRGWLSRELGLAEHGWRSRARRPVRIAPGSGPSMMLGTDAAGSPSIEGVDAADREAYAAWSAFVGQVAPALRRLFDNPAPKLDARGLGDLLALARDGWAVRRLGRRTMTELLRVGTMPVADWLRESFRQEALIEALMAPALVGSWLGPHSAGSAANLLAYQCLAGEETVGGAGALIAALVAACRSRGVELLTGAEVEGLVVESGRVRAVRCAGAKEIECGVVMATCDPKTALLKLVPPAVLPLAMRDQIVNWRCRGTAAKVHLALSGPLIIDGSAVDAARLGGGTIDHFERAFDAVKYRQVSATPFLEIDQPTVADPDLAPAGAHVLSVLVAYAPHELEGGWDAERRSALLESVVARIEQSAPGFRELIVGSELLAPPDLERRYAVSGGHLHHGEQALDQLLFVRPSHRLAHYATPVDGLFISGGGTHPGGGITGVPGWLAAGAVLAGAS